MPHVPHSLLRIALFSTFVLTAAGCDMGLQDSGPDEPGNTNTGSSSPYQVEPQTVALWRFSERHETALIPDIGPHTFHLSAGSPVALEASPYDSAAVFDATGTIHTVAYNEKFNLGPTGQITYEARIFMSQYPAASNFKNRATLIGMYAGPALQIMSDGAINIKAQGMDGNTAYWYDTLSSLPGVVPLNKWVNVAFSINAKVSPKQVYAYVDGIPVQLYGTPLAHEFRIYTAAAFAIGNDTYDNQPFRGKIEEARVSNALVLGAGLPIIPKSGDTVSIPVPTPIDPQALIRYWRTRTNLSPLLPAGGLPSYTCVRSGVTPLSPTLTAGDAPNTCL